VIKELKIIEINTKEKCREKDEEIRILRNRIKKLNKYNKFEIMGI